MTEIDTLKKELALQRLSDIGQEPVGMLEEDALGRGQVFWFNKPEDNTCLYTHPMQLKKAREHE